MRRLLLSHSQVSVALSSAVVLVFTFLLFLSGYILQQRTVSSLQATIRPRVPKPPAAIIKTRNDESHLISSRFFKGDGVVVRAKKAEEAARSKVDWSRLAHVQLVRSHDDVCNSIMLLADLHRMKSPARRVLLFPQAWAAEKAAKKGDLSDPYLDSSRRLLRLAARRFGVELRPVLPIPTNDDDNESTLFSLASVFALTDLDRALTIETPGLLFDAGPLDAILAYTTMSPFAVLKDVTDGDFVHPEDLMLFHPNSNAHDALMARLAETDAVDRTHISSMFEDPMLLDSSSEATALVRSIGQLHEVVSPFNRTAFLQDVAYIRFSDPKLPGPQYDIPWSRKAAARPKDKDADWAWTKLYGEFSQKRMEICGLDLETWRDK